MKHTLYLETSVISYQTSRPSRDLVVAARQQITRESWDGILSRFDCYISVLVIEEASGGDPMAAAARRIAIDKLPVLAIDEPVAKLAKSLVRAGAIPVTKPEDALHIAVAAANGIEFLLTWNFTHINNAFTETAIRKVIEDAGWRCPVLCSPEELAGDPV